VHCHLYSELSDDLHHQRNVQRRRLSARLEQRNGIPVQRASWHHYHVYVWCGQLSRIGERFTRGLQGIRGRYLRERCNDSDWDRVVVGRSWKFECSHMHADGGCVDTALRNVFGYLHTVGWVHADNNSHLFR
jgi:hypothetical protein